MAYSGHVWKAYDDGKTFEENFDEGGVGRHDWLNEMEQGIKDGQNAANPTVDTLSGATAVGKTVMKAKDEATARTAIGAGTSSFSGKYSDLSGAPTIPSAYTLPAATNGAIGGVKKLASQTDSTATDIEGVVADLNALLAKMRAAGQM